MSKKLFQKTIVCAVMGLVLIAARTSHADDESDQADFPKVKSQPVDRLIQSGESATFSVSAENQDGFQWTRNGEIIAGATNSTLTIEDVKVEDAGYYSCLVLKGEETVPTRSATMLVALGGGGGAPITVFGSPVMSGGGSGSGCPGAYAGYVNFLKATNWGWKPDTSTTVHRATDNVRSDTKVQYLGKYGDNACGTNSVTLPAYPVSPTYRFTIYFPNNVPATNYPITLTGFLP